MITLTFDVVLGRVFNAIPQMVPDDSDTNDVCVYLIRKLLLSGNDVVVVIVVVVVVVVVVR